MKLSAFIFGVASSLLISSQSFALQVGEMMPDFKQPLKSALTKKNVNLSDLKGKKGTLVIFSCNHCPYVKAWDERMVKIGNEYLEKGFGVVFINSNDPKQFAADGFDVMVEKSKNRMKFHYVMDETSDAARAFQATKTPEVFLFDTSNKLVYTGAIDDNAEDATKVKTQYLRTALDEVLAGKKVSVSESKALGCGIKMRNKKS